MEVIHSRCAGMDVSKKDAKVCIRIAGAGRRRTVETVRTWASTTNAILALRDHLIAERVTLVVMEATSDYWKPFYYLLEDIPGVEVMLVNARHVKNMPGPLHRASRVPGRHLLGDHRPTHPSDRRPQPAHRSGDGPVSFLRRSDLHHPRHRAANRRSHRRRDRNRHFPTARQLASWAGVCPGSNKSAGRVKSTKTRPGNAYLKAALGAAALSIAGSNGTFLAAKYKRLAARRGGKKALVAIEHTILNAIWSMATTGACGRRSAVSPNPDLAEQNADDAGPWRAAEH